MFSPLSLRQVLRPIYWTAIFCCMCLFVAYLAAFFLNLRTRYQAEALLLATRNIRVGESTTADVQRIVEGFHGRLDMRLRASMCPSADAAYSVQLGNTTLNWMGRTLPVTRKLGFRPWGVAVMFLLRQGRVCYVVFDAGVERNIAEPSLEVSTTALPVGASTRDPTYPQYFLGGRLHRGECSLTIEITPDATPTQKQHAFALEFSCITSFLGCQRISQLAPVASADVVSRTKEQAWIAEHGQIQGWDRSCNDPL